VSDRSGVDVGKLRRRKDELSREVLTESTLKCYRSDWDLFFAWCRTAGRESLPASAETLALYVTAELERGLKCNTLNRKLNSLVWVHRSHHVQPPALREARVVLRGAKRERREQPEGKTAISLSVLRRAIRALRGDGALEVRDRAVLLFGFATGLRRSEISRLEVSDVQFVREGMRVYLAWSKTDQEGQGRELGIPRAKRDASLCPVSSVRGWLHLRGQQPGPLFVRITSGGAVTSQRLGCEAIGDVVKRAVQRIGLDPAEYGAHSMRADLVTVAGVSGASTLTIMKRSGHKTVRSVERYFRPSLFESDPLAKAL
jgi:integrase